MADRLLLQGATLFDGTGSVPAVADVLVEDGRISAVGPRLGLAGGVAAGVAAPGPDDRPTETSGRPDRLVPLAGYGLLPGFIDCHVHVTVSTLEVARIANTAPSYRLVQAVRNLGRTLAAGVTTARDADGADAGLRQAVEDALVPGPRLQVAIAMLSQTGGRGDHWMPAGFALPAFDVHSGRPDGIADGPLEVRRMARRLIRAGADVLKVAVSGSALDSRPGSGRPQFQPDELAEVLAEAGAAGLPVMAHSHSAAGSERAVEAGVRSIEHGSELDEVTIDLMAEQGTWLVPTLSASQFVADSAGESGSPRLHQLAERHRATVRRAHRAGVRIAMGSDSGVTPHGANLAELAALVSAGLTEREALVAGTSSAAGLLGLDTDLGTVEVGKRADLVVVRGAPTPVDTLPERLVAVLRDGRVVAGRLPEAPR